MKTLPFGRVFGVFRHFLAVFACRKNVKVDKWVDKMLDMPVSVRKGGKLASLVDDSMRLEARPKSRPFRPKTPSLS
jgi:hypothetical protein